MLYRWIASLLLLTIAGTLAACSGQDSPAVPTRGPVVLAASSLQEALTEAAAAWTDQGHAAPVLSFAASSALARQIEQGAPADLFLSADEEWADKLEQAGLLREGTRRNLLTNRLALIRPKGGRLAGLSNLGSERLALADSSAVPAGKYAQAALEHEGKWAAVARNVVPAENVRAALALVERGEAALGIVYVTDANASGKVEVVSLLPEASHPPIRYPIAILKASSHPDAAAFGQFLSSAEAQAIFTKRGFGIAR